MEYSRVSQVIYNEMENVGLVGDAVRAAAQRAAHYLVKDIQLKVKLLTKNAKLPTRGSEHAAGLDLYAAEDVEIWPHKDGQIKTGIALEIPPGYFGLVKERSGFARAYGTMVQAGVIDSDYRGEVIVMAFVAGSLPWRIEAGQRIAQLLILPVPQIDVCEVAELDETVRGANGFGSTGR